MSWTLLQNSMWLAVLTTAGATLAGVAGAVFASSLTKRWQGVITGAAVAVFALPPFLVTNTWLNYFGLTGAWRPWIDFDIYSFPGTVLVLALQLWPIAFLFMLGRLKHVEKTFLEQEPLLRGWALWRFLLWPFSRSAVWHAAALIFVLALNNFAVPALLQTKVYPAEVWISFNTRFDYWEVMRLSWPLIAAPMLLLLYFRTAPIRFGHAGEPAASSDFRRCLGSPMRWASGVVLIVLLGFSLFLPLLQLLSSPRMWAEFMPAIAAARAGFGNSFLFAAASAGVVLILGVALRRWRWPMATWVLLLAPGLLLGVALIVLLNRPWLNALYQSAGVVIIAYAVRFVALGWAGARMAHLQADANLDAAARSFGAGWWHRLRLVEWPQSGKFLLGIAYLVYLLCLWDVETLIFIVPPGGETLALRIFNMLHYGHANQVDALCVWLLLLALAPLIAWGAWNALRGRRTRLAVLSLALIGSGCGGGGGASHAIQTDIFSSVEVIGIRGTGAGQFNKPRSLALDAQDHLYVVDLTGRVQKFSPRGEFELSWQMPQTDKGKPKGMLGDGQGGVIVIEPHYSRVNHFSPAGRLQFQWGHHGTNGGQLSFPRSVARNSQGEIYLSEYGLVERVQRFDAAGKKFLGEFGMAGTTAGNFNRPEGLGVDAEDRVYVADSCNHRVQIFTREGRFIAAFGSPGSGVGEMSYPYDVRVDEEGNIFVCEFGNSRIQIFNEALQPIGFLGGSGLDPGQMHNPWSIALDSAGNLFVADSGNHRVQKFVRTKPLTSVRAVEVSLAQ